MAAPSTGSRRRSDATCSALTASAVSRLGGPAAPSSPGSATSMRTTAGHSPRTAIRSSDRPDSIAPHAGSRCARSAAPRPTSHPARSRAPTAGAPSQASMTGGCVVPGRRSMATGAASVTYASRSDSAAGRGPHPPAPVRPRRGSRSRGRCAPGRWPRRTGRVSRTGATALAAAPRALPSRSGAGTATRRTGRPRRRRGAITRRSTRGIELAQTRPPATPSDPAAHTARAASPAGAAAARSSGIVARTR